MPITKSKGYQISGIKIRYWGSNWIHQTNQKQPRRPLSNYFRSPGNMYKMNVISTQITQYGFKHSQIKSDRLGFNVLEYRAKKNEIRPLFKYFRTALYTLQVSINVNTRENGYSLDFPIIIEHCALHWGYCDSNYSHTARRPTSLLFV